jgi:hypothetical protein
MAETSGLQAIVWINEHEVGVFDGVLDGLEPSLACLSALSNRPVGWNHLAVEDGIREDIGSFQGSDMPLIGGDDPVESFE